MSNCSVCFEIFIYSICYLDTPSHCEAGKYGELCGQNCIGNCKNNICNQVTGKCDYNCAAGWKGYLCLEGYIFYDTDCTNSSVIGDTAGDTVFKTCVLPIYLVNRCIFRTKPSLSGGKQGYSVFKRILQNHFLISLYIYYIISYFNPGNVFNI